MHAEPPHPTHDQLRREISALRASRERLILAADADRHGIQRELHDGVQQDLVAVAVNLQLAEQLVDTDPAAAKTLLREIARDVGQALREAARLAQRVDPPLLETGLAVALRAAAVGARIPVSVDVASEGRYPHPVARTVFLCCVDPIERAGAEAKATVSVRDARGQVFFEVVVTGGPAVRPEELLPLRDRVEALGGRLTIASEAGVTRVSGSVPLAR